MAAETKQHCIKRNNINATLIFDTHQQIVHDLNGMYSDIFYISAYRCSGKNLPDHGTIAPKLVECEQ
jgi:hypothetical protein